MKLRQFIPALIVAAGLAAYHNSFQGPFILDDVPSIVENPQIRHLWPIWDALSPSARSLVGGRPIVNFSLAVNYALGGLAPRGYHALNLTVHILAALTLFGFVRRTLLQPRLRGRFDAPGEWIAVAVAVLWMVHPLQTEAVTYISQRCESLMGLFYLFTLYCFVRGAESARPGRWFALSVAACFLGIMTKEVMATAPLMVLLYDRTFVSGSFREAWHRHRRLYLGMAGSWLLLGCLMAGLHNRTVGYGLGITWWGYALMECRAVVLYLRLALWPRPLIFDYGEYVPTGSSTAVASCALILAILALAVLFTLKRRPAIGFAGAWFFVILAPTTSVVPIVGSPVAEHRMYLPLAAVVTAAVVGAVTLGKRLFSKQQGVVLGCVAGGAVAVLFTLLTIQRNRDYNSEVAIWQDTLSKRPKNSRAENNLASALLKTGKVQEATVHLAQALRLKPDNAKAYFNLGIASAQQGRVQEAMQQYEQALRLKPDYAEAHNSLGLELAQLGQVQEAIGQYEQALQLKPNFAEAHNNLGVALIRLGRVQEAVDHWERALRLDPDDAEAHYNLGNALLRAGKMPEAIEHYERALRIQPDHAKAQYNLGSALYQAGRVQEAMKHWEEAVRIDPDYAEAHHNLGSALARLGRVDEAVRHWEQAVRINPDFAEAHKNLGAALMRQGKLQEAIGHYEQAVRIKPDDPEAHFDLGNALLQAGKPQPAIEQYEQAVRLKPDFAAAHNNLAAALMRQGKLEQAIDHYEQVVRLMAGSPVAHYNLGVALEQAGRVPEAIQHYEQALRIKPDFVQAQNALTRARSVTGR